MSVADAEAGVAVEVPGVRVVPGENEVPVDDDTGAADAGSADAPTATPVTMATSASIRVRNLRIKYPSQPRNKCDSVNHDSRHTSTSDRCLTI